MPTNALLDVLVLIQTHFNNKCLSDSQSIFVTVFTIKRTKGASETRARGVLIVKILNKCILNKWCKLSEISTQPSLAQSLITWAMFFIHGLSLFQISSQTETILKKQMTTINKPLKLRTNHTFMATYCVTQVTR